MLTVDAASTSTIAVGAPFTLSATGDVSITSMMSVSGSAGTLAILADSNGNGNGILLFTGSAVAGISGCTGGVTTVSLTGNDIELDPLPAGSTSVISIGSCNLVITQSVASGSSDGVIVVGGTTSDGYVHGGGSYLWIDQSMVNRITSTGTVTIGGLTTSTLTIDQLDWSSSNGNPILPSQLSFLSNGGLSTPTTPTGSIR